MKNILLLGATGSIGDSVLSVISQNSKEFNLYGISFNKNISLGNKIIENFSPSFVHIDNQEAFQKQSQRKSCTILNGDDDLESLIKNNDIDIIVCATSGLSLIHI